MGTVLVFQTKVFRIMKKILILPLYGIGDALMTTPALRNIKENLEAEITYLHMFAATWEVLSNNPYVDRNIFFPLLAKPKLESLRFLARFRKKYEYSINFYPSNRKEYNLSAFISGSKVRIGHRYLHENLKELNFLKTHTVIEDDDLHCVEENLKLLEFLGIKEPKKYPLEFFMTEKEEDFSKCWLKERIKNESLVIGLHSGTASFKNHAKKRWPLGLFVKLINKIAFEFPEAVFLIFGGSDEKSLKEAIVLNTDKSKVFNVDFYSIRQSAALMRHCNIFISNDSGLMHLAAALKVRTIAIFGPTNPVWVKPWRVKHEIIRSGFLCSPCFSYSPRPLNCSSGQDYACVKDISVDMVFMAFCKLLKEVETVNENTCYSADL